MIEDPQIRTALIGFVLVIGSSVTKCTGDNTLANLQTQTLRSKVSIELELGKSKAEKELARIRKPYAVPVTQELKPGYSASDAPQGTILIDPMGMTCLVGKNGVLIDFAKGER